MCGIAGVLGAGARDPAIISAMIAPIRHRGPDDDGVWSDAEAGVALGHRRLSIIDLSAAGHQPMESANGRFIISFNGEIYNHPQLRKMLDDSGFTPDGGWRGHSDTETLLQAIAAIGLRDALSKCVGMFALALWDREQQTLSLVRDRFGEKPLAPGDWKEDFRRLRFPDQA